MENFQLVEDPREKSNIQISQTYHLVKGDLYCRITIWDRTNLNIVEFQFDK
jgi:hypothetical protein